MMDKLQRHIGFGTYLSYCGYNQKNISKIRFIDKSAGDM